MIGLLIGNVFAITISVTAKTVEQGNLKSHFRSGKSSDRDLLGLGLSASRFGSSQNAGAKTSSQADTLRILAIRVDFAADDNSLTTGNGKFDLSTGGEAFIDPAPHDRTYFEHQLQALSNYYKSVSRGQLVLAGDVYPQDANGSYTVSQEMSFYVPPNDVALLDQRLSCSTVFAVTETGRHTKT